MKMWLADKLEGGCLGAGFSQSITCLIYIVSPDLFGITQRGYLTHYLAFWQNRCEKCERDKRGGDGSAALKKQTATLTLCPAVRLKARLERQIQSLIFSPSLLQI